MPSLPRFPVIAGPTAGGKSELAIRTAELLGGPSAAEIITADSVQIFRGLDIGSAKPTPAERRGITHHLIDIAEPTKAFTVADWLAAAERAVAEIQSRGRTPILVGGTHLYLKAFLEGLFQGPDPDPALRQELRALGLLALRRELERVDPTAAQRIHPNDERRTVRALEVFRQTGAPISQHQQQWDRGTRSDCTLIGLDWPPETLARRINARVKAMIERGLVDEVRRLAPHLGPQAREALGYAQILEHLDGKCTLEEAVEEIKIQTRRFAKSQRTWLRRLRAIPGSVWIDAGSAPETEWPTRIMQACRPYSPYPISAGGAAQGTAL